MRPRSSGAARVAYSPAARSRARGGWGLPGGDRLGLALALSALVLVAAGVFFLHSSGTAYAQDAPKVTKTLLDYIKDGGVIGHTILLCSIAGVSLSIAFAFQIRRDVLVPPELLGQLEQLFEDEEYEEAFHLCEANPSFLSAVLASGLAKMDAGYDEMQRAMVETGDVEATKLHQKVGYLQVIAAIAPMLGLFGTVYGMIVTFTVISTAATQPKPAELAGGISTALVTTFEGLLVAIPMTVLYVIFRNRVVNVIAEIGGITEELTARFKAAA